MGAMKTHTQPHARPRLHALALPLSLAALLATAPGALANGTWTAPNSGAYGGGSGTWTAPATTSHGTSGRNVGGPTYVGATSPSGAKRSTGSRSYSPSSYARGGVRTRLRGPALRRRLCERAAGSVTSPLPTLRHFVTSGTVRACVWPPHRRTA